MTTNHCTRGRFYLIYVCVLRQIDVAFLAESVAEGYKKLGLKISCAKSGPSFMMRKDMANVMQWYDDAVKKIVVSDDFKRMCSIAKKAYGM